jgi:hypothetical protein
VHSCGPAGVCSRGAPQTEWSRACATEHNNFILDLMTTTVCRCCAESLVGCLLAALLHLQPSTPGPSAAAGGAAGSATTTAGDIQALQCLLLDVLPMVCKACNAGVLAPSVGVQVSGWCYWRRLPAV